MMELLVSTVKQSLFARGNFLTGRHGFGGMNEPRKAESMAEFNVERLKERLKELNMSPRALSLAIGGNAHLVTKILIGSTRNPRTDTLVKMANVLSVDVKELMTSADAFHTGSEVIPSRGLQVRFRIQSGVWRETSEEFEYIGRAPPLVPMSNESKLNQWLEIVMDASADREFVEGTFVHVEEVDDEAFQPSTGQWVVVLRMRAGGNISERSLRQVAIYNDRVQLCQRSTVAKWSKLDEPGVLDEDGDRVETKIVGRVIGAYRSYRI